MSRAMNKFNLNTSIPFLQSKKRYFCPLTKRQPHNRNTKREQDSNERHTGGHVL